MQDIRKLLAIKAEIEKAMKQDIETHTREFAQQLDKDICEEIEEARAEWDKLFESQEIDQLRARVKQLEAINKAILEELESQRKKCPWKPEKPDCSDSHCMNQENCNILKVISKAKGRTNGCRS